MGKNWKLPIIGTIIITACALGVLAVIEESGRKVELHYAVKVNNIPSSADKVSVWIPIPRSNSIQHLEDMSMSNEIPYIILTDKEYGNRFLFVEMSRDMYKGAEFNLTAVFRVNRKNYTKHKPEKEHYQDEDRSLKRFLSSDRLVPVEGKIQEEAYSVTKGVDDPFRQAKILFDHIVETMEYDKSGVGWGRGDALYACDVRTGNCTDFHSLYIGEIRALGIPARFIIGFPLPSKVRSGIIPGYHCWAEFYIEGKGWIPLDASEAKKNSKKKEKYFGNLDENRISFTVGRDIRLPRAHTEPLNYVIYPHVEVDNETHTDAKIEVSFRNI